MMLAFFFGDKYSFWNVLQHYWLILPISFLVSVIATPICRKVAIKLGIMDYPDDSVKTHKQPTAYLGGIGILAGFAAGLLIGFWILFHHESHIFESVQAQTGGFTNDRPNWLLLAGIGFGAGIACIVGVLDDILDLKPKQKFLGQIIAALILVGVGIRPNLIYFFHSGGIEISQALDIALGIPMVLFFILGATNSLNLLDGLDGLCAGVTAVITIAFLLLAVSLATWAHSPVGDPVRLIVCLALAGGTLGFLPLNRYPAKIFMGDAGSMLLGFVAGTLMILLTERIGRWTIAALVIFGLPILDTAVALVRRFLNKRPLFVSDRGHIYDQLMDRNIPLKKTVFICYLLAGLYALIGLAISQLRLRHGVIAFVLVFILSSIFVWRGGFLKMPPLKKTKSINDDSTPVNKQNTTK